jgi:2-polyprenyl-3-methyl-5-hydroxy-6-metoxy-1,4-benzoquinol methylase
MKVAKKIKKFIINKYPNAKKIVDVGAGQGYFQAEFDGDEQFEVLSIEGSKNVPFVANPEYRFQEDFCTELPKEFENYFDLLVSFECIEHIHQDNQEHFWDNVKRISNKALVGIHAANGEHSEHCFIRNQKYWDDYFLKKEISAELLGAYNWEVWPQADCSLFYSLEWK